MPGMQLFHGNLGRELDDSQFPMLGMQLFHRNLGREQKDSNFLMARMPFFHGKLRGELEDLEFLVPECSHSIFQFWWEYDIGAGGFKLPDTQNALIPWEFGGNLGEELEDLKFPTR